MLSPDLNSGSSEDGNNSLEISLTKSMLKSLKKMVCNINDYFSSIFIK